MSAAPTDAATAAEPVVGAGPQDEPSCSACPHPWADHDAIARRFCTASGDASTAERGCVCR